MSQPGIDPGGNTNETPNNPQLTNNSDCTKWFYGTERPMVNQLGGDYFAFPGGGCATPIEYDLQTKPPIPAFQSASGLSATQMFLRRFQPPI